MRFLLLIVLALFAVKGHAETVVVRRNSVVVTGAQDAAVVLARRGSLVHTGCGMTEGIGFSTVSADAAIRNCCYWGKRKPLDIGVARGPRGWFAVVRYQ